MHLDLLAIAAHPDDVELTCGGTLLKMAQRGYKTGILDLTAGEMGTRGTAQTRAKEAAKSAKLLSLNGAARSESPIPTFSPADSTSCVSPPSSASSVPKPSSFLTGKRATRPLPRLDSRVRGMFSGWAEQLPLEGEPYRPFKILYSISYADVRPTFVVDISAQYQRRRKAILAFSSQFRPPKSEKKSKVHLAIDRLEAEMNQLVRHYGQMIGVDYGEPFLQKELMKVDDVVKMEVRSI